MLENVIENGRVTDKSFLKYLKIGLLNYITCYIIPCWNLLNVVTVIVYKSMLNYLKERTKY